MSAPIQTTSTKFDFGVLYERTLAGGSFAAAGSAFLGADFELDTDECAEVMYIEIDSPQIAGTGENLTQIIPWLDGATYGGATQVVLLPRYEWNVYPLRSQVLGQGYNIKHGHPSLKALRGRNVFMFGIPSANPLFNCTMKYKDRINFRAEAAAAITQNITLRAWGFRYKCVDRTDGNNPLRDMYGDTYAPDGVYEYLDPSTGRRVVVRKGPLAVTRDNFTKFAGGGEQDLPYVNPLVRWARNVNATTVNTDLQLRYTTGAVGVSAPDQDMYWDLSRTLKKAVIIERLGIRAPANMLETVVVVNSQDRPRGRFPTTQTFNPIHFGLASPTYGAAGDPKYMIPPELDLPILIQNEIGYVAIRDNGTQVAANGCYAALHGIEITFP